MKKLLALIFGVVLLTACNDDDAPQTYPTPTVSAGFKWRENDPNGTDHNAATAEFNTAFNTMIARDDQNNTLFEINLSGSAAGTYTVGSGNAITFTAVNPYFAAESGEVVITANANGKMSGTFEAFRSGTGTTRLYGTFNDITVNP